MFKNLARFLREGFGRRHWLSQQQRPTAKSILDNDGTWQRFDVDDRSARVQGRRTPWLAQSGIRMLDSKGNVRKF